MNTYYSLAACCVTAFAVSSLVSKGHKFDMVIKIFLVILWQMLDNLLIK